ncbi:MULTISPECIES: hypothetical protein [unclassified Mesorhizobium]|uniref:hypothetical protein n=1 Tax=unclassified Mesorhizobium TaxID=325217 RepID=UPI001FEE3F6D|nr:MULTISPECIES: hypothetical protein [unclassified Mesorhizobium]
MELIQIDHTKADISVVDEETRRPIGRPWLHICSRIMTGFYLTMEAPFRLSTSLCLLHSVFDKSAWLREREIAEPWPVTSLLDTLHVDNRLDFRSIMFKRECEDAGIAIVGRTPLRRSYRASDRNADGEIAGVRRIDSKRHAAQTVGSGMKQ